MDTPETDKAERMAYAGEYMVPTEFARHLELERDQARDAAKKAKAYKRVLKETNAQLKRERDEARDALMRIEDLFIDGTDVCADREKMGSIARAALEETK